MRLIHNRRCVFIWWNDWYQQLFNTKLRICKKTSITKNAPLSFVSELYEFGLLPLTAFFLNRFVVILFISNENLMLMLKTRWSIGGNGLIRLQKNLQNDLKCSENPMAQHISWQLIYRFNWRVVKSTPDAWATHKKHKSHRSLHMIDLLPMIHFQNWESFILPCYRSYWSDVTQKMFALYGEKNYGENQFWSCVFTSDRNSDRRVCRYFFACLIYL